MAQDDTLEKLLILAGAGIGLWYLYEQGFLYQWTGIAALYPGTLPSSTSTASTTGSSTGAATSTTPAATSSTPASTPAAATFQVIGAATADINNSLYANVSINGGAVQGLAVIPSNGTVWLGNQNITNTLVAEGINIDSLIAAFQAAYTPSSSSSSSSTGSSSSSPDCGGGLTASDAATLVYDPSTISASDMDCVSASLDTELQSGQIATIQGNSVLAYMLGWGGASSGETQSVYGLTYKFNGTNWILQSNGTSGFGSISWGTRVPMEGIHGMGYGRVRRGWLT